MLDNARAEIPSKPITLSPLKGTDLVSRSSLADPTPQPNVRGHPAFGFKRKLESRKKFETLCQRLDFQHHFTWRGAYRMRHDLRHRVNTLIPTVNFVWIVLQNTVLWLRISDEAAHDACVNKGTKPISVTVSSQPAAPACTIALIAPRTFNNTTP